MRNPPVERVCVVEMNLPGLNVTIEDARFGREMELAPARHDVVAFNLSRTPVDIHACYISRRARGPYRRFGSVSYVPAGIGLHMFGKEAGASMLMCRFEQHGQNGTFANAGPSDVARLEKCTDIRNRDIVRALERIAEETLNPGLGSETLIAGIAATLAVDLLRLAQGDEDGLAANEQLRKLEAYCAQNIAGRPSLTEAAGLCGVTARQLALALKQASGLGFSQFVAGMRLRQARQMLRETGLPIKEISYRCGFSHVSSFTSAFREAEGRTPHRYRLNSQH